MSAEFTQVTKSCLLSAFVFEVFLVSQGRSYGRGGGSWGALNPPFVNLFLRKQPTIFRWRKLVSTLSLTQCVTPLKILATPLQ